MACASATARCFRQNKHDGDTLLRIAVLVGVHCCVLVFIMVLRAAARWRSSAYCRALVFTVVLRIAAHWLAL
eukprot:4414487-Lingulodinium_polyedra.AAC.1